MKLQKNILPYLILLFGSFSVYCQDLLVPVDLKDQAVNSELIVEGIVVDKNSFEQEGRIFTKNTIQVSKIYKGARSNEVSVITKGGFCNNRGEVVNPSLHLSIGDRGVFFLKSRDISSYDTYANKQSFYKYNELNNSISNPFEEYQSYDSGFIPNVVSVTKLQPKWVNLNLSNKNFTLAKRNIQAAITNFSPTSLSAGTSSVLTINGSGFGTTTGDVLFSNADDGGKTAVYVSKSLIVSWSDTQIKVKVPFEAGTGNIAVKTSGGTIVGSTQNLTISYSRINLLNGSTFYTTYHLDKNNAGGYTWEMNKDFYANSSAKAAFERSFNAWKCAVGMNWNISTTTTSLTTIADDGHNVITFTTALGTGVLGECTNYYSGGYNSKNELIAYVTGFDIGFKSTVNWNYSANAPSSAQYDFESTVLHELGHGLQLHHVIDTNELMHYFKGVGSSFKVITTGALSGSKDIVATDLTVNLTNVGKNISLFDTSTCTGLGNSDFNKSNFLIYPNPSNGIYNIHSVSNLPIDVFVFNLLGEKIYQSTSKTGILTLDLSESAKGIYFVKVKSNEGNLVTKIIKE